MNVRDLNIHLNVPFTKGHFFGKPRGPDLGAATAKEEKREAELKAKQEKLEARNKAEKDRQAEKVFSKKRGARSLIKNTYLGLEDDNNQNLGG